MNRPTPSPATAWAPLLRSAVALHGLAAAGWLAVGCVLQLVATIRCIDGDFAAGIGALAQGRIAATATIAIDYGWGVNAALAAALWLAPRLRERPASASGVAFIAAVAWNVALAGACVAAQMDFTSGFPGMPFGAQSGLFAAITLLLASANVLHSLGAGAATLPGRWLCTAFGVFPVLFALGVYSTAIAPAPGLMPAIAAAWAAPLPLTLALVPAGLALAYARAIDNTAVTRPVAGFAPLLHATWLFAAPWIGLAPWVASPVPAWMPAAATSMAIVLGFVAFVLVLDLWRAQAGSWDGLLARIGILGLAAWIVLTALSGLPLLAGILPFTRFADGTRLVGIAAAALLLLGALRPAIPEVTGEDWKPLGCPRLLGIAWIALAIVAFAAYCIAGGWSAGTALAATDALGKVLASHAEITRGLETWNTAVAAAWGFLLAAAITVTLQAAWLSRHVCLVRRALANLGIIRA